MVQWVNSVIILVVAASEILAETQQNYYITRNSFSYVQQPDGMPAKCPRFPTAMCDDSPNVMDKISWNSTELKDGVFVGAKLLGLYDCVTYTMCGYRIYDSVGGAAGGAAGVGAGAGARGATHTAATMFSSPREYLQVRDALPMVSTGNCTSFPPPRCPGVDMGCCMGNKTWHTQEVIRGGIINGEVVAIASECATYSLCGHRIYMSDGACSTAHGGGGGGGGVKKPAPKLPTLLPDTPLQYIEARVSIPHEVEVGISTGCALGDYPPPAPCNQMHLYVGQDNWHEPVLRNTVIAGGGGSARTAGGALVGVYDCVTRSLCAYANPAPFPQ